MSCAYGFYPNRPEDRAAHHAPASIPPARMATFAEIVAENPGMEFHVLKTCRRLNGGSDNFRGRTFNAGLVELDASAALLAERVRLGLRF